MGTLLALALVANVTGHAEYTQVFAIDHLGVIDLFIQWAMQDLDFRSYYFLCWFTQIWAVTWLPCYMACLYPYWRHKRTAKRKNHSISQFLRSTKMRLYRNERFSWTRYTLVAGVLAFEYFFSIYMWFVSLNLISVAIVSTLSRACVIFVAPLSVLFLKERLPWTKICSLVLVLIGVILVGVGSYYTADERFSVLRRSEGIATMLLSAFLFACYQVTLKRTIGDANTVGIMLVQSMCGLFVACLIWIMIPVWNKAGIEPVVKWETRTTAFLFANVAFEVSYVMTLVFGTILTSPLYFSVTTTLAIPVAGVTDWIVHGQVFSALTIAGMSFVLLGVILMNVIR